MLSWLKPYNSNKLELKSSLCLFLGYSFSQSAYLCLDVKTHKIYTSRHVCFVETEFPFSKINTSDNSNFTIPGTTWPSHVTIVSTPSMFMPCLNHSQFPYRFYSMSQVHLLILLLLLHFILFTLPLSLVLLLQAPLYQTSYFTSKSHLIS